LKPPEFIKPIFYNRIAAGQTGETPKFQVPSSEIENAEFKKRFHSSAEKSTPFRNGQILLNFALMISDD
jgi:hypothetical protein